MRITNKQGFTLIELLIVVAIIGILAAIAIPNFLEAQTRAKVARLKSDMKTFATALEIYNVDNNSYIPHVPKAHANQYRKFYGGWPTWIQYENGVGWGVADWLTSPVAYISTPPADPFSSTFAGPPKPKWCGWWYYKDDSAPLGMYFPYPGGEIVRIPDAKYFFFSVGPDIYYAADAAEFWLAYDPTNGTVSYGNIFYAGLQGRFIGGGGS